MIERAVRRVAHVPRIRTTVTSSRWMAPLTSRFVAGTTTGDALGVAADLASQGLRITAHVRQGDGASDSAATGHVESYGALMHGLSRCDVPDPEVSVKIRQLGYQPGAPTAPVLDRLAHLARGRAHFLLEATIIGNCRQYAMPAILSGINQLRSIRRETGTFILSAFCQHL